MTIQFNTYLKDEDWMPTMGGWRCEALLIPGANFEALYHDGRKADSKDFEIENHIIRWSGSSKPKDLLVTLSLTKDLPKLEEEKLHLEKEKLNLEQKKASIESRWKVITAIGAVISSILTFSATYLVKQPNQGVTSTAPPRIHTYAQEMSISENECKDSLARELEDYGLQRVTPVGGGIYAVQGNYNIFIACDADLESTFLVVSGSEDSEAKAIREDIKSLLP